MATTKKKQPIPSGHYCLQCQTFKELEYYHKNPMTGKRLPYCKSCLEYKYKTLIRQTGKEEIALWCMLAELGIPFLRLVWDSTYKFLNGSFENTRKPSALLAYLKFYEEASPGCKGFWESDIMLTEFTENEEEESKQMAKPPKMNLLNQKNIWGEYKLDNGKLNIEAYEFLNKTFDDYTRDIPEMDANLINRYRDLCKAEWRLRKANEIGDGGEISKAQDALTKQLTLLKLNDFTTNKKSDVEKFIERRIWEIENTKPAECEDLEIYKDFSGFQKPFEDIMRCVQNLVAGTREYPKVPRGQG